MAGYKQRADGRYSTRIRVGTKDDGKPDYKYLTGNSEEELSSKVESRRQQSERHYVDPEKTTLSQWLVTWLRDVKKGSVEQNSYEFNEGIVNNCIIPHIGSTTLADIKPNDLRALYSKLRSNGLSDGRINQTHGVISQALDLCVEDGILSRNFCKNKAVKKQAPRPSRKSDQFVYEQDQIDTLLRETTGWWKAFIHLAWASGMRREELLGLRWSDIDMKNKMVSTSQAVTYNKSEGVHTGPLKNDYSYRTLKVDKACITCLEDWKVEQIEAKRVIGITQLSRGLVFSRNGEPTDPRQVSKDFKAISKKLGMPDEGHLHSLRHTHATQLLRANVNLKIVSYRLGHSSIQITADIYSHVKPDMQDNMDDVLEKIRSGK